MNKDILNIVRNDDVITVEDFCVLGIDIGTDLVDEITSRVPDVEENEVAALLYTIEKGRIYEVISDKEHTQKYMPIPEGILLEGLVILLQQYTIENLIGIFEELKYFQIQEVLNSANPINTLYNVM